MNGAYSEVGQIQDCRKSTRRTQRGTGGRAAASGSAWRATSEYFIESYASESLTMAVKMAPSLEECVYERGAVISAGQRGEGGRDETRHESIQCASAQVTPRTGDGNRTDRQSD